MAPLLLGGDRIPESERWEGTFMDITWEIRRTESSTFDIFRNATIQHKGVPESALEGYLDPYGIIGNTYQEVRRQLRDTGRAEVTIPVPGKAEQV